MAQMFLGHDPWHERARYCRYCSSASHTGWAQVHATMVHPSDAPFSRVQSCVAWSQTNSQRRAWLQVCTAKMNLSDEVDLEDYVGRTDRVSAAEITSICQEAGMQVRDVQPARSLFACGWKSALCRGTELDNAES